MDSPTAGNTGNLPAPRLDKHVYSFGTLDDRDEIAYWRTRTPEERLAAVELLRRINYGDAATTARLQRVFEFAQLGES